MKITPFGVEIWMNAHENTCAHNLAETCVHSITLGELLELAGKTDSALQDLPPLRLGYGAIEGSLRLRGLIADLYERQTPSNVTVAHGAIGANALVHAALVEPGDRVICVTPTYQQHYSIPASYLADLHILKLRADDAFLPDLDALRALATPGTRLIALNNPNNPTGALMDEAMLRQVVQIARDCGAWLLCDEVYRKLEQEPGTTAPSVADLYEKGVSSGSMSKSYSLAGLRAGWVAGPPELVERCLEVRDYTTISCGVLDDALATIALEHIDKVLARSLAIVRENLPLVDAWVAREPRLRFVRPRAGTTALIRYENEVPSVEFCQAMFDLNGAFVMPGAAFGEERCFRLGYACARDVLVGGLAAISEYLGTLER